jgi:hypothetical protein
MTIVAIGSFCWTASHFWTRFVPILARVRKPFAPLARLRCRSTPQSYNVRATKASLLLVLVVLALFALKPLKLLLFVPLPDGGDFIANS